MRSIVMRATITALLAGVALCCATALFAGKYATVVFEAEEATNPTGKVWYVKKHGEDPGGKASGKMLAVPKSEPGEKPKFEEVTYKVNIPQNGYYYLWARVFWKNGCGNSVYFKMEDEKGDSILGGDGTYNALHWVCLKETVDAKKNKTGDPLKLPLKKGTVTFVMGSKESATEIDQFVLTTDPEMYPANSYKPTPNALVKNEKKDAK